MFVSSGASDFGVFQILLLFAFLFCKAEAVDAGNVIAGIANEILRIFILNHDRTVKNSYVYSHTRLFLSNY